MDHELAVSVRADVTRVPLCPVRVAEGDLERDVARELNDQSAFNVKGLLDPQTSLRFFAVDIDPLVDPGSIVADYAFCIGTCPHSSGRVGRLCVRGRCRRIRDHHVESHDIAEV